MKPKLGVLVIGRKRPGFDQEWNARMRAGAVEALTAMGFECIGADARVVDDQTIIAALDDIRRANVEALVILQPSLGNGQLALTVTQQWEDPVVLWATPERKDVETVSSCSLVAQHLWASIYRQAQRPFEIVYGDPADAAFRGELGSAISICRSASKLRRAKVGLIGSHAPGFLAMQADIPTLRRALGVQLHNLSLAQFIDRVRAIDEAKVSADVEKVRAMRLPMDKVTCDDLAPNSRYYLAMKELIEEEKLDALALQCWPELPNTFGWAYLALSRVANEGFAVAMEGDVDGALTCLLANHLGIGAGFITDWLEHDEQTITFWHAGTLPLSMCDDASLAPHFNIQKPLVVDGTLRENQDVTIVRIWRCDDRYHATAFQGRTIPPPRKLSGNYGTVGVNGGAVPCWFNTLCHAGFPHHPVVFYGHHADRFRSLARMLNVQWHQK